MKLYAQRSWGRKNSSPRAIRFLAAIFLWIFVVFSLAALILTITTAFFRQQSVHVEGRIIALIPSTSHDAHGVASTTYTPVFSFTTTDGKTETIQSSVSSSPPPFAVGDSVPVLYRKGDPGSARLDVFLQIWFVPMLISIFAFAFGIAWFVIFVIARNLPRPLPEQNAWNAQGRF